jgi:hypothetical protein
MTNLMILFSFCNCNNLLLQKIKIGDEYKACIDFSTAERSWTTDYMNRKTSEYVRLTGGSGSQSKIMDNWLKNFYFVNNKILVFENGFIGDNIYIPEVRND